MAREPEDDATILRRYGIESRVRPGLFVSGCPHPHTGQAGRGAAEGDLEAIAELEALLAERERAD